MFWWREQDNEQELISFLKVVFVLFQNGTLLRWKFPTVPTIFNPKLSIIDQGRKYSPLITKNKLFPSFSTVFSERIVLRNVYYLIATLLILTSRSTFYAGIRKPLRDNLFLLDRKSQKSWAMRKLQCYLFILTSQILWK